MVSFQDAHKLSNRKKANKLILLTNSSDWRPWLFVIKSMALSGGVWKYINPDLETQIPEPTRPAAPSPAEAISVEGHTTFADK